MLRPNFQRSLPMRERPRTAGATSNRSTGFLRRQGTRRVLSLALAGAALHAGMAPAAADREPRWPWPLETEPRAITGTFMEARGGGYHAGLDLRTEGRTGLAVRSPVDGWVSRVRTSPRGYGKALYLQTTEGTTVVLAHLARFHAPVQEYLREAMRNSGRYEQDLTFEPGRIVVRRGEIVALSGDTGIGAPHLHLEVRDAAARPLNPQSWLDVPDTVAPSVRALRLVPFDARAEAEKPRGARAFDADAGARLAARGTFVVQVDVDDRTGFSPFGVAPFGVILRVDGEERYRIEQDSFDFEHAMDLHLELERVEDRRWWRLHRRDGLRVPAREGSGEVVAVRDRPVAIEIEVYDHAGLRSKRQWILDPELAAEDLPLEGDLLRVEEALVYAGIPYGRAGTLTSDGRRVDLLGTGPWKVVGTDALDAGALVWVDGSDTLASTFLVLGGRGLPARRVQGTGIVFSDPAGRAAHPGGSLRVDRAAPDDRPEGMRTLGASLDLRRIAWAPREGVQIEAGIAVDVEHAVWMQRTGSRWTALVTSVTEDDGVRRARTVARDGGTLVLAEDRDDPLIEAIESAPFILHERSTEGPHGLPQPRWPPFRIAVTDRGSGIGDRSPEVLVDGRPHPAVWDPERATLVLDWFVDPGPGPHRIDVWAVDLAGRETVRTFQVRLVPRA